MRRAILLVLMACGDSGASSAPAPQTVPTGTPATQEPVPGGGASDATIEVPGAQSVDEEKTLSFTVKATARVFAEHLPPGARFDEKTGSVTFTPDFTQGGQKWTATFTAGKTKAAVEITANDTIKPAAPVITKTEPMPDGWTRLTVTQTTDTYLDSPTNAGRTFTAIVSIPTAPTGPLPVRVGLHGFDGAPDTSGWKGEYRIFPHDPNDTYWWGYGENLKSGDPIPDYTVRRVMNLLSWVLSTQQNADPNRVYLDGVSMGGAGAMTIGLLHARHFCHVRAGYGQAIPRNHRPSRVAQLTTLWGPPSDAWNPMDLTQALLDSPEARDQFLTIHHAKDDDTIHFGAVTMPSPLSHDTFYGSLQKNHVGHLAVWDEGGHVSNDPLLGADWWSNGWDPVFDDTALLRRDRAFVAFSKSSLDRNPGTGSGNGKRTWNVESGYAGVVATPGDTGWDGDIAGVLNRFLRWDGTKVVDTIDRFEIPIAAKTGDGAAPPKSGYPTKGDALDGVLPATADVTPRRLQSFATRAGESIAWTYGDQKGTVVADATGAITIPALKITGDWQTMTLSRAQ